MSDPIVAINYVLRQEDSAMSGKVKTDPRDNGGRTRYGIAERFHPDLPFFFTTMNPIPALAIADRVYQDQYAKPLMLADIQFQRVANAALSFAVNEGVPTSIKIMQTAASLLVINLTVDGVMGQATLKAINLCDPDKFLVLLGNLQQKHYIEICEKNPSQTAFINGWLNRVRQNCGIA